MINKVESKHIKLEKFINDPYFQNFGNEVDPGKLIFTETDILQELGMDDSNVDDYFNTLIKSLTLECRNLSSPKAVFRLYDDFNVDKKNGVITINNLRFDVKSIIASQLLKSEYLIVFAVTAGDQIENYSEKLLIENHYPEGYIVNGIGSATAEATADFLHNRIETLARNHHLGISNRFSPGYCNWDVSEQHLLFKLLPEKPCDIALNDSALMMPIKSVTGILGLGRNMRRRAYKCNFCDNIDCIMRNNESS